MGPLEFLFVLLVVFVVVPLLFVLVAGWLGARALRRHNQLSPHVRTAAPTSWLGQPGAAARLHRRLRDAVTVGRTAASLAPPGSQVVDLAAELEQEAVAVDQQLVVVAKLRNPARRVRLSAVADQVARIEQVASQLSIHAAQSQAPIVAADGRSALDQLADKLDALEQARAEVTAAEEDAGVQRVSPYVARPSPGTPSPGH